MSRQNYDWLQIEVRVREMFEDIKVGDTVLLSKTVRESLFHHSGKSYFVRHTVDKVTPKQFQIGGKKFKKSDGRVISSTEFGSAYKEGMTYCDQPVVDQTQEYKDELHLVNYSWKVSGEMEDLGKIKPAELKKLGLDTLNEVSKKLKEIQDLIKAIN